MILFKNGSRLLRILIFAFFFFPITLVFAERGQENPAQNASAIQQLKAKLTKENGEAAKIAIFKPVDYTNLNLGKVVEDSIYRSLARYGKFDIKNIEVAMQSLTLENFREEAIKQEVEIIMVSVLKPNAFDLFLYDRRTPYYIYAYSQDLPDTTFYKLSEGVATHYTRLLVRRLLYRYVQNQFYELPRLDKPVVIPTEIPRRIATTETLAMINNEVTSRVYMGALMGSALTSGLQGKLWNSNLLGIQLGIRPWGRNYIDLEIDMFAYNAFTLSLKHFFLSKDTPFRLSLGLGVSHVIAQKTLAWDQTNGLDWNSSYVVPSAAIMLPISDVYIKFESRFFAGIDFKRFIFTFTPGILVLF